MPQWKSLTRWIGSLILSLSLGTAVHAEGIRGIDVSKYQGHIDWHQVKSSGVKFAYIKATQGSDRVDDRFHQNWHGANLVGLRRGAYHFVNWCDGPGEIRNYINTVPRDPHALPPVLDVETTPRSRTCKRVLHPEHIIPEIHQMLRELESHFGRRPIIYTGPRFYRMVIAPGGFDSYPLWVASYSRHPREHYGDRRWTIWQHSERGRIPGIRHRVDLNKWHGDFWNH